MKKLISYIYSAYVILVGVPYLIFASLTGILFFKVFKWKFSYRVLKYFMRFVFIFLFVRVKIEYEEELSEEEQFVFVANHISIFDVPIMGAFLPGYVNAIEAHTHFEWPIYKHLIKGYQQIPINRSNVRESLKSFKIAEDRIKEQKRSIMVFPEGHRTEDGNIQEFKKLPFVMAQRSETPVIPIGISGMWKFHPNNGLLFSPAVLKMKFGKRISVEELKSHNANQINQMAFEKVKSLIEYK